MFSHRFQALLLCLLLGSTPVFAQTMSQEDAFAAGKAAGDATKREAIKAGINDTAAGNLIQGYSNAPPAQSGYWTGNKTLVAPAVAGGQQLQTDCLNTMPTDPAEKARCEAIRAVVGSNAAAPAYSGLVKKTDAIYLTGKAVGNDPESIAGSINGTYTACTTETLTTPGDMILETCDEAMTNATLDCVMGQEVTVDPDHLYKCTETMSVINTGQCTVGTVVQVDADANYQCEKTEDAYQTFNCDRTANVTVTQSGSQTLNCTPGQLIAGATGFFGSPDMFFGYAYCHTANVVKVVMTGTCGKSATAYLSTPSTLVYMGNQNTLACGGNTTLFYAQIFCTGTSCYARYYAEYVGMIFRYGYSPNFTLPELVGNYTYTANVSWDNQCAPYEARAQ
ncbi:MAG: hypothetical protein AB1443_08850 [Pseudomonadota bacterium]